MCWWRVSVKPDGIKGRISVGRRVRFYFFFFCNIASEEVDLYLKTFFFFSCGVHGRRRKMLAEVHFVLLSFQLNLVLVNPKAFQDQEKQER